MVVIWYSKYTAAVQPAYIKWIWCETLHTETKAAKL